MLARCSLKTEFVTNGFQCNSLLLVGFVPGSKLVQHCNVTSVIVLCRESLLVSIRRLQTRSGWAILSCKDEKQGFYKFINETRHFAQVFSSESCGVGSSGAIGSKSCNEGWKKDDRRSGRFNFMFFFGKMRKNYSLLLTFENINYVLVNMWHQNFDQNHSF